MVHVTALKDDYYFYDEERYLMVGERTNNTYKLGEKVKVVVTGVDKLLKTIDFELASDEDDNSLEKKTAKSGKRKRKKSEAKEDAEQEAVTGE